MKEMSYLFIVLFMYLSLFKETLEIDDDGEEVEEIEEEDEWDVPILPPTPIPTLTPQPTEGPYPTLTPQPTEGPFPTFTPQPSDGPNSSPTSSNKTYPYPCLPGYPCPYPYPYPYPYPTVTPTTIPTHGPAPSSSQIGPSYSPSSSNDTESSSSNETESSSSSSSSNETESSSSNKTKSSSASSSQAQKSSASSSTPKPNFKYDRSLFIDIFIPMTPLQFFGFKFIGHFIWFRQLMFTKSRVPHFHVFIKIIIVKVKVGRRRLVDKEEKAECLYEGAELPESDEGHTVEYNCGIGKEYDPNNVLTLADENGNEINDKIQSFAKHILYDVKYLQSNGKRQLTESDKTIVFDVSSSILFGDIVGGKEYTFNFTDPPVKHVKCSLSEDAKSLTCPLKLDNEKHNKISLNNEILDEDSGQLKNFTTSGQNGELILQAQDENSNGNTNEERKDAAKIHGSKSTGLSGGAIAGIIIGSVVVLGLAIFGILYCSAKPGVKVTETTVNPMYSYESKKIY